MIVWGGGGDDGRKERVLYRNLNLCDKEIPDRTVRGLKVGKA